MTGIYEEMIQFLIGKGYGYFDGWFTNQEVDALRQSLMERYRADGFKQAAIGDRFNQNEIKSIRSDQILWLDKANVMNSEQVFFNKLNEFVQYLNRTCYAGVNSYEFHYAVYEPGTFYKRHKDQFSQDDRRKYSLVMYLNENWQAGNGGELVIYADQPERIEPHCGRIVFFDSEMEHEVLTSNFQRMSLTGWLRTT